MTNKQNEYENLEDKLANTTESVYVNPVFDGNDEAKANQPLLDTPDSPNNDDESPYEEVAANVSNKDDPTMLCLTFRSIFLGIFMLVVMSFITQFFAYRTSPLSIDTGLLILITYVIANILYAILPEKIFGMTINPGPFTVKEHTLIVLMALSGINTSAVIDIITVQRHYYHYYLNHFSAVLFIVTNHLLAFSIAGILKRYLVWPAAMIWPDTLLSCALIRSLNSESEESTDSESRWKMKRSRFFWYMVLFQFIYYWFPGYIFPLLSFFSIACMIAPNNIVYSQITSANGLGVGAIELDWSAWIGYLGSPILVPFWAHVNMFIGFVIVVWIATPILYYSNVWDAQMMPIVYNRPFDMNGNFYNTSKVLDKHLQFNETAYDIYGGMRLTTLAAVSNGFCFAGLSAMIVHTALYYGKTIVQQFRASLSDKKNDIHARLMSHYPDISERWFYAVLLLSFILGLVHCFTNQYMSITILISSIVINFILMLPIAIITAITSMLLAPTVITDFLSNLIVHGNPIGYLIFRTLTATCQGNIINFLSMFKFAHYMKIPPRIIFPVVILSPVLSAILNYTIAIYLLNHVPNICTSKSVFWRCLNAESYYTSSIIWGIIGVDRTYGPSGEYFPLLFGFLIGLVLPIISWCLWKKFPNIKWLALVHFPIILLSTNVIPPAPAAEFVSWFVVGFTFNFVLYRYAHLWWEKYAYIFSAGMSCGVAICGFVIFFALQNNGINFPNWWGKGGANGDGCPLGIANYSGIVPNS